jgi:hypothetical protein
LGDLAEQRGKFIAAVKQGNETRLNGFFHAKDVGTAAPLADIRR